MATDDAQPRIDGAPLVFANLLPGAAVAGHARVLAAEAAVARTGSPFHRLTLADPAGVVLTARRFGVGAEAPLPAGAVVRIAGTLEEYRGALTLKLSSCAADPAVDAAAFLPRMPAERRATLADLDALVAQIADPALRAWVGACLPPAARARLALHPAAVRRHGAAVGGLLAHTVRVANIARYLADLAPGAVDRDVLLAASLLHDLGKLEALDPEPGREPTARGRLLGHVALGAALLERAAGAIAGLAPERVDAVLHAVLAHHGRLEWGAAVEPQTPAALLLHLADAAEARLETALEERERRLPGPEPAGAVEVSG